jgi:branched-chain amino acid transport system substrate-binding protein
MTQKNDTPALITALLITLLIILGGLWLILPMINRIKGSTIATGSGTGNNASWNLSVPDNLKEQISTGSRVLVPGADNEAKQFAAKAIAAGNKVEAIKLLSDYLQKNPNDPEAWIYRNNLEALSHNPLKIAVVVPIPNLNIAQEMLRGAAQAQTEINKKGGINGGQYIQIAIANDDNDPVIAPKIAQALVDNPDILAIVGHNASNASLPAAKIYQAGKLVMVNPTSFANGIPDVGDYIFRVVPNIRFTAQALVSNVIKTHKKTAICYDSQAPDGVSFQQEFVAELLKQGGQLAPIVCDLSDSSLKPQAKIVEAIQGGAGNLLILPHIDRLQNAYDLAAKNNNRLKLYGNSTLATIKTLENGKSTQGLTIAVPWSPKNPANSLFARNARLFWGGDVSWRTAGDYDAVYTVATGLGLGQTRSTLQNSLQKPGFIAATPNGEVKFLPNGDSIGQATIVQVKPSQSHQTGYDFVLVSK